MNNKKIQNQVVALTQIIILLTSLIAVSYLVGSEFQLVSAADDDPKNATTNPGKEKVEAALTNTAPVALKEGIDLVKKEAETPVNNQLTNDMQSVRRADDVLSEYTPSVEKIGVWDVVKKIGENAIVGAVIGAAIGGLSYWISGNERFSWNIGIWTASVYTGSAFALWGLTKLGVLAPGSFLSSTFPVLGLAVSGPALIAAGAAALLVLIFYREEKYVVMQYSCSKWEPRSGGEDCDKCNRNANLPCTLYKCQSLGANCELLNQGKNNERCAFVDRNDPVAPSITSNSLFLPENFSYDPTTATMPSNSDSSVGVKIKYTGQGADADGCIPSYKILTYGISLNKLGRCKADTVRTNNYSSMKYSLSDGTSDYNHSIYTYFMNSTVEYSMNDIVLRSGEEYETHVRCNSTSGAENLATFVFKYCVQDEPDTWAPWIKSTSPVSGSPIRQGETSKNVSLYLDKYSECKWDRSDFSDINQMANNMSCSPSPTSINGIDLVYECKTTLTGLLDEQENDYYFLCKSYPNKNESDRYANTQASKYTLIGTKELVIQELSPEEDEVIRGSTQFVNVSLEVTTFGGYDNGKALCSLKNANDASDNYQLFVTTDSHSHKQSLWLESGIYSYSIMCCDEGLNCDEKITSFEVESDLSAPRVIRINNELRSTNQLRLTTNEKAECAYSITDCTYNFADGIKFSTQEGITHFAEWDTDNNFYVKCRDDFTNQPATDECSVIVRPFNSN